MKILFRILLIATFLGIGYFSVEPLFEWFARQLFDNGYIISSNRYGEVLVIRALFVCLFASIPLLYGFSHKLVTYRYNFLEYIGQFFSILFGALFVIWKLLSIAPIRTAIPNVESRITIASLKINQYFFFGILSGFVLFILLCRLFKLVRFTYGEYIKRSKIQDDLDQIGKE